MFKNKVIVITGSAQGIGKQTAQLAASYGAKVVINSRTEVKVKKTIEEIVKNGGDAIGLAGDVSDYNFCLELNDFVISNYGRIDYLINNAAISTKGTLKDSTPEALENAFRINLFASFYATKAMMDEICKQKGGILFISSLASIIGLPSYLSYSTTKRAMVTAAECLRNELIDDGVFVGVNFPGFTENDDDKQITLPTGERKTLRKRINVKVSSRKQTSQRILDQLKRRKFRHYSSPSGYFIQYVYRLIPTVSLWLISRNRERIIHSDEYPQSPIIVKGKKTPKFR